jgi:hypothetical protein
MFIPEPLATAVAALPPVLRERARALHKLVLLDGRTWLQVAADHAEALRVPLHAVLAGGKDRRPLPTAARRRAWWEIHEGMGRPIGPMAIGRPFGVYPNAVVYGLGQRKAELEREKAIGSASTPAPSASPMEKA